MIRQILCKKNGADILLQASQTDDQQCGCWLYIRDSAAYNLEAEPYEFDGIYTGTETRDAVLSTQHLQPYHSYPIFRYFDNLNPGHNGGGRVDTGCAGSNGWPLSQDLPVYLEAPGQVSLFVYDNNTVIVESFLDTATACVACVQTSAAIIAAVRMQSFNGWQ